MRPLSPHGGPRPADLLGQSLTASRPHVSDSDMSSVPQTSIRADYKEQTRTRILDAAIALMSESGEEPFSIAQVAARAGVTDRTVYRHFETREALLQAVWPRMQERVGSDGFPQTPQALVDSPRRLFPKFDRSRELVRASVYSAAGLEVRLRANEQRMAATRACVRNALPELDQAQLIRRAAVVQLINSAYAWEVMRQFSGLDGEEAGEAASEAIAILIGQCPPRGNSELGS